MALARKLAQLVNPIGGKLKGILGLGVLDLAEQYRKTRGWYYTMKPMSDATTARWLKRMETERAKVEEDRNEDLIWFCDLRLKGIPTPVGNFRLNCFYTLVRADGKRDSVVEIVTDQGERSGRVRLDAESFSVASGRTGFRTWLKNHANAGWKGGDVVLQELQLDILHDSAFMDVQEVTAIGYDVNSKIWFMGDCAYAGDEELLADEDGVYWHNGMGYLLAETGSQSQPFLQVLPLMHPGQMLEEEKPGAGGEACWRLAEAKGAKAEPTKGALSAEETAENALFAEMAARLKEALGGYDAFLVIGAVASFFGRPEFFRMEKCFPGLFLHGETKQGKSTTMQWAMELPGFQQMSEGLGLGRDSTPVGLQIGLEQFSSLPFWLSDYNAAVSEDKQEIIHGAFNARTTGKYAADGVLRKKRTMFVIDGESRPVKTSTRFRYLQVLISKRNMASNQVWWFERNRRFFFRWAGGYCGGGKSSRN